MTYKTKGTCSTAIDIEVNDGIIESVQFTGVPLSGIIICLTGIIYSMPLFKFC